MRVLKLHCGCVVLVDDSNECFTLYSCQHENPWQEEELVIPPNSEKREITSVNDPFFEDFRQRLSSMVSDSKSIRLMRRMVRELSE